jgi:streptogramin lyase
MEAQTSSPRTTLLILLGASEWPQFPEFQSSQAFANAARGVRDYFLDPKQFGIPLENALDAFDSQSTSDELDAQIGQFLEQRLATMKANGQGARDLLVYFVGHGGFVGRDSDFYLAIRRTRMENPRSSGLSMLAFADTLAEKARYLRRIIILDCCYAAAAFSAFQASPAQVAIEKTIDAFEIKQRRGGFPAKGTTLLCSSGHKSPSLLLPDSSSTMFTKAVSEVLAEGIASPQDRLSLREVKDLAADLLSGTRNAPKPIVLSPDQSEGDVADIPFFPNPYVERERARLVEEERRRQAEEAEQTRKIEEEKRRQAEEERAHQEKEQADKLEEERARKAKDTVLASTELAALAHQTQLPTEVARSSVPPPLRPDVIVAVKPANPGTSLRFVLLGLAGLVIVALLTPVVIVAFASGIAWLTLHLASPTRGTHASPAGSITEFLVPTAQSNLDGIAAGPDGNLWFTEFDGNKIGRISPGGTITEFPVPTLGSHSEGITAGPDGNLWFTEFDGNKIGRISLGGTITEFPVSIPDPTLGGHPEGIAAGPDGNLWFTEFGAIGRISPSGTITEFPVPTAQGGPYWIAAGPDGNLWFTEELGGGENIGRISPSGTITEFPTPTLKSGPYGITAGPDGNLWFTESGGNKIGRFYCIVCHI